MVIFHASIPEIWGISSFSYLGILFYSTQNIFPEWWFRSAVECCLDSLLYDPSNKASSFPKLFTGRVLLLSLKSFSWLDGRGDATVGTIWNEVFWKWFLNSFVIFNTPKNPRVLLYFEREFWIFEILQFMKF